MLLNYVIAIVDRENAETMAGIFADAGLSFTLTTLAAGTATRSHLAAYGLAETDKATVSGITNNIQSKQIFKAARNKLYLDIPGNGIIMTIPVKSIVGRKSLEYLTSGNVTEGEPDMEFKNELIIAIMNEGYSDLLMAAARTAGAGGGTCLHAKGTGSALATNFFGMSIADEKDIVYIVAAKEDKAAIMKAIHEQAGPGTKAGAICFSLPISHVMGIRSKEETIDQ